jgi:hypothetical protein
MKRENTGISNLNYLTLRKTFVGLVLSLFSLNAQSQTTEIDTVASSSNVESTKEEEAKYLVLENTKSGKRRLLKSGKIIKVWIGETKIRGRAIIENNKLVIKGETIDINSITILKYQRGVDAIVGTALVGATIWVNVSVLNYKGGTLEDLIIVPLSIIPIVAAFFIGKRKKYRLVNKINVHRNWTFYLE